MELKFGHRVIAWKDNDAPAEKGRYVSYYYSNDPTRGFPHYVLLDGTFCPTNFRHARLDPEATEFLRGDKVEFSQDGRAWRLGEYAYKSIFSSAHYDIDSNPWKHCRYPRKDQLHGKTAIIDGKEYELRLK